MTAAERLSALPTAQRQALALGFLAVVLSLAWYGMLKPLHGLVTSQAVWREQVQRDLAEARGKANIDLPLAKNLEALHGAPLWRTFYSGATEEEANVQIQQDLRGLGASAGITALALAPLPKKDSPDFIAHGVHLNAAMTAEQLKRFSVALRSAPHFLRVERFAASAPQIQSPDQNPPLSVSMDVYGYSRADAQTDGQSVHPPARGST